MNIVIGNTSQQSYYYPEDYIKVSSRNIDLDYLSSKRFESAYITFAEQRIYEENIDYIDPNFRYTLDIIDKLLDKTDKIAIFTSCELWSNKSGVITNLTQPDFDVSNQYTLSKLLLLEEIKRLRKYDPRYNKVVIIHPFYFNSIHRSKYFLFGKIFDSIINEKHIEVGNIDFYRDMVHTKFMVKKCIELDQDSMVGSGKLFNVRDFVIDLYDSFGMRYDVYVKEDRNSIPNDKLIRADVEWNYSYQDLLEDTINDLKKNKKNG
jgi:GDP-D-mannose dehydratase